MRSNVEILALFCAQMWRWYAHRCGDDPKNNISKGGNIIPDYIVLDGVDMHIVDDVIVTTRELREKRRQYFKQADEFSKKRKSYSDLSNFIFHLYRGTNCFANLKPQTAARLMYLATFMSYKDGLLYYTQRSPMNKKFMMEALALKRDAFEKFFEETTSAGLLIKDDDGYFVNTDFFAKGEVKNDGFVRLTKVFVNSVRQLYLATDKGMHQYLGFIFMLIPYVNKEWNIICHNPDEEDRNLIKPMTLGEFCDAVGYDRKNSHRMIENFRNITFDWHGHKQRFCTFVYEKDKSEMRIFCNPNIFYTGKHFEQVETLGVFFK